MTVVLITFLSEIRSNDALTHNKVRKWYTLSNMRMPNEILCKISLESSVLTVYINGPTSPQTRLFWLERERERERENLTRLNACSLYLFTHWHCGFGWRKRHNSFAFNSDSFYCRSGLLRCDNHFLDQHLLQRDQCLVLLLLVCLNDIPPGLAEL